MAAKKGKALALDLIDELLKEDKEDFEINADKTENQILQVEDPAVSPDQPFDFSASAIKNEDTLDINKTEISNPSEAPVRRGDIMPNNAPAEGDDKTMRLNEQSRTQNAPGQTAQNPAQHSDADDKVRASVGRFGAFRSGGPATSTEAALAQSESLRIAQSRLLELEQEIERLRLQNEELAAAGETLRRRGDELMAKNQKREHDYQNAVETFEQEKQLLTASKEAMQRDAEALRRKNEELELRVTTNIQKIRVRERELENRLELVKMESAALIRSKDEMVLELKRNIDQLNMELNNYRSKNQELNRLTTDKQEMLRRTVKALRLALSMLEGEEDTQGQGAKAPQRKAK
jgi:DNA repair exonuclease SbcCD ATPase subunit